MFQQLTGFPFADVADLVELLNGDCFGVFFSKVVVVYPVTSHGQAHAKVVRLLLLCRFLRGKGCGDGVG